MSSNTGRNEYEAALLEVDLMKLPARVRTAEAAIRARAASLNGQATADELISMEDALNNLGTLRRIKEE
jgi:hypothetical protein